MKSTKYLLLFLGFFIFISCEKTDSTTSAEKTPAAPAESTSSERDGEFYQLKTYTFDNDEQIQTTDQYLKDAFLPGLKKLNINNVGVFKQRANAEDTVKKIYVLIPFSTMAQFLSVDGKLEKDDAYLAAGDAYINASHDNAPYSRLESTLMKSFEKMPFMKAPEFESPRPDRIYELRSYESATEKLYKTKVDMFNAGGESKIFEDLGFNAVFYGEVISGSKMPNLMYMTTFSDQESRDAHWDSFRSAPAWSELKAIAKYNNTVSHSDKMFLYPTEYSDY